MESEAQANTMSIGQLGHHVGLHVSVNLSGKVVGETLFETDHWEPGVVVGLSAAGDYVTIKLDEPLGGGERHGLFHRPSQGQELISIDDPAQVRPLTLAEAAPDGVPQEIVDLVHAGKTLQAIKRYRALNGATLEEAQAAVARLSE